MKLYMLQKILEGIEHIVRIDWLMFRAKVHFLTNIIEPAKCALRAIPEFTIKP